MKTYSAIAISIVGIILATGIVCDMGGPYLIGSASAMNRVVAWSIPAALLYIPFAGVLLSRIIRRSFRSPSLAAILFIYGFDLCLCVTTSARLTAENYLAEKAGGITKEMRNEAHTSNIPSELLGQWCADRIELIKNERLHLAELALAIVVICIIAIDSSNAGRIPVKSSPSSL